MLDLKIEDKQILNQIPFFAGLGEDALSVLLGDAHIKTIEKDAHIFMQGDNANNFYVILSGWAKIVRYNENGGETVIALFSKGETIAEVALFGKKMYPASALAIEDLRLIQIPIASFKDKLYKHPEFCFHIMGTMSSHLHYMVQKLEKMGSHTAIQKLAEFIISIAKDKSGKQEVTLPMDKALIASKLGIQPETFSRTLKKLKSYGVISSKSSLIIEDINKLKEICNS